MTSGVRRLRGRLARVVLLLPGVFLVSGCGGPSGPRVVVYAAQDRVFAEPVFRDFQRVTGIEVLAVYDNEATKTTGLANRLLAEKGRPQADLWWSNEEMRTRQLVRLGVLESGGARFGERRRVLVCASNRLARVPVPATLSALTQPAFRGRVAMAFPLFGTTATHLLVLRQRWGEPAWRVWCQALRDNRPLLVDGNSVVVRLVASGDAWIGVTDTDDVAAAQREGLPVVAIPLGSAESMAIPNTVAEVRGARHPEAARRLADFLATTDVSRRLARDGAFDLPGEGRIVPEEPEMREWDSLIDGLDSALGWLGEVFGR